MSEFDKLKPTDMRLSGSKLQDVIKNKHEKYLNDNFSGWVSIVPALNNYIVFVDHWTIKSRSILRAHYTKYYRDNSLTINSSIYALHSDELDRLVLTKYAEKEPKRIVSDNDPWGEEDWDLYLK